MWCVCHHILHFAQKRIWWNWLQGVNFTNILQVAYCTKVFCAAFLYLHLYLHFFCRNEIGKKLLINFWWNWLQGSVKFNISCVAKLKIRFCCPNLDDVTFIGFAPRSPFPRTFESRTSSGSLQIYAHFAPFF